MPSPPSVSDLIDRQPSCLSASDTVELAIAVLLDRDTTDLFVLDRDRKPLGYFSLRDGLRLRHDPNYDGDRPLGALVTPCTVRLDLHQLPDWHTLQTHFQTPAAPPLPVLDDDGCLAGVLTGDRLLQYGAHRFSQLQHRLAEEQREQQLLQAKLVSSYEQLHAILGSMQDIVLEISLDNPEPEVGVPGSTDPELAPWIDLTLACFFEPPWNQNFLQQIQRAIASQRTIRYEYQLSRRDDDRAETETHLWFEARISPLPAHVNAPDTVLWVARDITARKRAERAQGSLAIELERRVEARTAQLRSTNAVLRDTIRKRKEAQQDLQHLSDRLIAVLDAIPGFVAWFNASGHYEGVNRNLANLYGLTPEDFAGRDLDFPSGNHQFADFLRHFLQQNLPVAGRVVETQVGDLQRQYLVVAQKYDRGRAAITVGIDITERRQFEVALQQQQRLFQQIADASPDVLYVYSLAAGGMVYVNDQIEALTGYSPERVRALAGEFFPTVVHPDDLHQIRNSRRRLRQLDDGELHEREFRLRNPHGEWRWIYSRELVLTRNRAGIPEQIVGIAQDVSDRKRSEAQLRRLNQDLEAQVVERTRALQRSETRFRSLFEQMAVGVAQVDCEGRWQFVNQRLCEMFGYSAEELAQRTCIEMTDPDDRDLSGEAMQALREGRRDTCSLEKRYRHADGSQIWANVTLSVVRDRSGENVEALSPADPDFVVVVQDISDRKRAEAETLKALAQERELIDLKSRFVSMASHEFRTPLAIIKSSAQLLQRYDCDREEQLEQLEQILSAVSHMAELLDDVLTLAKSEAGTLQFNPSRVELTAFCRQLLDQLQRSVARDRLIDCQLDPPPLYARADEKLLRQILSNLVSNALKYSPPDAPVDFSLRRQDAGLELCVRDRGIGIPPQDIPRLFESFHRAENVGTIPGTGLGLAIVRRCIDLHGGTIAVRSQVGEGTQVTVCLPQDGTNGANEARTEDETPPADD